jgi:hypothetical protein
LSGRCPLLAKNPIIELKSIVEVNAVDRSVQRCVLSLFTSGGLTIVGMEKEIFPQRRLWLLPYNAGRGGDPTPPPFSAMNSTPADSRAVRMAAIDDCFASEPFSMRDGHDAEPDTSECCDWSSDPAIAQEGPRWHGNGL